jgi:Tfp pilus assembly protein PilN
MPLINLIEEQRISRRSDRAKARTALITLSVTSMLTLSACAFLWIESEGLDAEVRRLHDHARKVKPILSEIESSRTTLAKMEPKMQTLENAHEITGKWNRILNHLTVQTPPELWLTAIRATSSDPTKPIEVNYMGIGSELNKIGEYILRIQSCEDLENVNLKFTQEKVVSGGTGIEFEIYSSVVGTAEAVDKSEDAKAGEGAKK